MSKSILLTLLLFTSLFARDATQNELNDIYFEAILFVCIFGTMGIISFFISKKHAKEYVPKKKVIVEKTPQEIRIQRISELKNLYNKEVLTLEEFEILEKYLK